MDRLATLEGQLKKIDRDARAKRAKIAEVKKKRMARETTLARQLDMKRKIITGAIFLNGIKAGVTSPVRGNPSSDQLCRCLDAGLTTERDRKLFPELANSVTLPARPEPES